jgi:type IV pilus assembly protein PilA
MSWFSQRINNKDEGFTLVELMVVVLIIAILIAIAIPTFLGARERAQDRAAQSNLRNALTSAKVYFTDTEDYAVGVGDLNAIEPSLNMTATNAPVQGDVGYTLEPLVSDQLITFVAVSGSTTWFCISDNAAAGGGTTYNSSAAAANAAAIDINAECGNASW